jgi:ArsR family transcriptional regulator
MTGRTADFEPTMDLLRALAEPTRFRLLALLSHGELTVGEMARVLKQSQPRISRHLKLLSDVAALERFQEEQRVYYRLTGSNGASQPAAELVAQVLRQVRAGDPVLERDRRRLTQVLEKRVRDASADWQDVRSWAESTYQNPKLVEAVRQEVGEEPLGELLDVGTGSGSMLKILGARAQRAVGLDMSTRSLRVARAKVHGAGLSHCEFKRGDMYALPFDDGSFDAVTFDHVMSTVNRPERALSEGARVLRPRGRVIVIEIDSWLATEGAQQQLRSWLDHAGLQCDKIKAIGAPPAQLLFAEARAP